VLQRLERDGLIVRRAVLPAPMKDTAPFERQGPYSGLMGLALVALLLVVHLRPAGMPDRLRRPCAARLPEELGTLEAPVHPGRLAAPFGYGREPGLFLPFGGGGLAFALCAEGDAEPRGEAGTRAWEGLAQGEIGLALRVLRDSGVKLSDGLSGDPELGDEGLHQERIGRDATVIGGKGWRRLDGLDTLGNDSGIAHVMRTEAGCESGTARELRRLESRPAPQAVAEDRRVSLLKPVQHVRERVLQGTGQTVGKPDCVADHAAPVCDELGEGTHRGALGLERLQLVAMHEQPCELACGLRGVIFGPAGREGFARPRQGAGVEREEDEKGILAQGGDQGAFVAFETDGHGLALAP